MHIHENLKWIQILNVLLVVEVVVRAYVDN